METLVLKHMKHGLTPEKAVAKAFSQCDFERNIAAAIKSTQLKAAGLGMGMELTASDTISKALSPAWSGDGVTFSKRLHSVSKEMRTAMVDTIADQLKLNVTVKEVTQALYDGYSYGHVTKSQDIPKYLDNIISYARRSELGTQDTADMLKMVRQVRNEIDSIGDNTSALKNAYKGIMEAVEEGSTKALDRAVEVAVEEKSRNIALRVARTESARAYFDGFAAKWGNDSLCVAYRWNLGTAHDIADECDMYAEADMFNLGAGVFPKDQVPALPVHPNCLCQLEPVFQGEVDMSKMHDQSEKAGKEWLQKQPLSKQRNVLGYRATEEFQKDGDWQSRASNYHGFVNPLEQSRLKDEVENGIINMKIDELTPCLRDSKTGELVNTQFSSIKITPNVAQKLRDSGWNFNWGDSTLASSSIYQLNLENDNVIQGLIALEKADGFVYAKLAESNPRNIGVSGLYKGVGGLLFAIACEKNVKYGFGGVVCFDSKTKLVSYYNKAFGAISLGGTRMAIFEDAAAKIMEIYGGGSSEK